MKEESKSSTDQFSFRKYLASITKPALMTTPISQLKISAQYQALFAWAKENGAILSKIIYPALYGNSQGFQYAGLGAIDNIEPNEIYISIPSKLFMTSCKGWKIPELKSFMQAHPLIYNDTFFEAKLIITFYYYEKSKGEKSFWSLLFNCWNFEYENGLFLWNDSELALLQDNELIQSSKLRKQSITDFIDQFYLAAKERPDLFNISLIDKGKSIYIFSFLETHELVDKKGHYALIPIAELINHAPNNYPYTLNAETIPKEIDTDDDSGIESEIDDSSYLPPIEKNESSGKAFENCDDSPTEALVIRAKNAIKKGEQPCITYHKNRNWYYLCEYGFVQENSLYDAYFMPVHFIMNGKPYPVANKNIICGIDKYEKIRILLFQVKFSTTMHSLSKLAKSKEENNDKYYEKFQSYDTELEGMQHSLHILKKRLSEYKTSVDMDNESLKCTKSYREYAAILFNREQKKILHAHVEMLTVAISVVNGLKKLMEMSEALANAQNELKLSDEGMKIQSMKLQRYFNELPQ